MRKLFIVVLFFIVCTCYSQTSGVILSQRDSVTVAEVQSDIKYFQQQQAVVENKNAYLEIDGAIGYANIVLRQFYENPALSSGTDSAYYQALLSDRQALVKQQEVISSKNELIKTTGAIKYLDILIQREREAMSKITKQK